MLFQLSTANEIASALGQRLRDHRLIQNLQQSELAARAGISERALRNIERGGKGTFENIVRVVQVLGLASQFDSLFEFKPRSIKAMEAASIKRKRAS
jgi:transcriptional regulator with XRE-family HTH domain